MVDGAELVRVARSFVGTPFHHQGRLPGVGIDCIGVVAVAAHRCGLEFDDPYDYPRNPEGLRLLDGAVKRGDRIAFDLIEAGDVLLFQFRKDHPQHLAFYNGEGGIIHAFEKIRSVVEHRLDDRWIRRFLHSCWRLKGVG